MSTNPWCNDLIKREYQLAVSEALKDHLKRYPRSKVSLIESFDNGPGDGFRLAKKKNALGVLGYLYSAEAFEAASMAKKEKIPYLSPVSPLDAVRNNYAFSMALSHTDMTGKFQQLAKLKEYSNPSIVLMPETQISNFEYEKVYRKSFAVTETLKGKASDIWEKLEPKLKKMTQKQVINVLFAGFAFEQMELATKISSSSYADRVRIIAHSQWNYCPRLLKASLSKQNKNLFLVTDYFDVPSLDAAKLQPSSQSIVRYREFDTILTAEPKIKGHEPNEPIVYVLRDMVGYALEVAEHSKDRTDFLKKFGTGRFEGSSGTYKFTDKNSERRVYLGKWDSNKIVPVKAL